MILQKISSCASPASLIPCRRHGFWQASSWTFPSWRGRPSCAKHGVPAQDGTSNSPCPKETGVFQPFINFPCYRCFSWALAPTVWANRRALLPQCVLFCPGETLLFIIHASTKKMKVLLASGKGMIFMLLATSGRHWSSRFTRVLYDAFFCVSEPSLDYNLYL